MSSIQTHFRDGLSLVRFNQPELSSTAVIGDIAARLSDLLATGETDRMVLNFAGVEFLNSEMLGQLALLKKKSDKANVRLKLCGLNYNVASVLRMVRLDTLFEIAADEAEAMRLLARRPLAGQQSAHDHEAQRYQAAAEAGDAEAQYQLGRCFENGWGVAQDSVIALQWYGRAVQQNHAEAQNALAHCYAYGIGIEPDYNLALPLYRQAAEQGVASAQYVLGLSYEFGIGLPANPDTAARWYRLAAYQGDTRAQEALRELD